MMVEGFFDINEDDYSSFISKKINLDLFYNAPKSFKETLINEFLLHEYGKVNSKANKKCKVCGIHHHISEYTILDSGKIGDICSTQINLKKDIFRENNRKIIRMIMNGSEDEKLFQTRNNMTPLSLEEMAPSGTIPKGLNLNISNNMNVEFHHICYNEKGSKGKLISKKTPVNPSYWANKVNMYDVIIPSSYEGINQFMLCNSLSPDAHKLIHSLYAVNNITNYLNPEFYDFFNTPYYLKNKGNYETVIDYLENKGYDIDNFNENLSMYPPKFSSYKERIEYLSDYEIKKAR